jgi:hypothetical protein
MQNEDYGAELLSIQVQNHWMPTAAPPGSTSNCPVSSPVLRSLGCWTGARCGLGNHLNVWDDLQDNIYVGMLFALPAPGKGQRHRLVQITCDPCDHNSDAYFSN